MRSAGRASLRVLDKKADGIAERVNRIGRSVVVPAMPARARESDFKAAARQSLCGDVLDRRTVENKECPRFGRFVGSCGTDIAYPSDCLRPLHRRSQPAAAMPPNRAAPVLRPAVSPVREARPILSRYPMRQARAAVHPGQNRLLPDDSAQIPYRDARTKRETSAKCRRQTPRLRSRRDRICAFQPSDSNCAWNHSARWCSKNVGAGIRQSCSCCSLIHARSRTNQRCAFERADCCANCPMRRVSGESAEARAPGFQVEWPSSISIALVYCGAYA